METGVSLKYFVNDCFWKHFLASNSPQNLSNLFSLTALVPLRSFTQFFPDLTTTKLQKKAIICITLKLLCRSFH